MNSTENALEHSANDTQMQGRQEITDLFRSSPIPEADKLFNLGLYARSGLLVKFLVMADLYQRVLHIPGALVEFGVWYGQNLVLMENLRAIYEPFNKQRRIIGFDTFNGYLEDQYKDSGLYATGPAYIEHLSALLAGHAKANVYGHLPAQHELVDGDVCETANSYFAKRTGMTVALAYFDMGPALPTGAALRAIKPHLVSGSVLLLDEYTLPDTPGEAKAFHQVFGRSGYKLEKCALYPSKAIVTIL